MVWIQRRDKENLHSSELKLLQVRNPLETIWTAEEVVMFIFLCDRKDKRGFEVSIVRVECFQQILH